MIREATERDEAAIDELFAIGAKEFVGAPSIFEPIRCPKVLLEVEAGEVRGMLTVADLGRGTVGVGSLVVRPEHRGKGIGRALIQSVEGPANVLLWDGASPTQRMIYAAAGFKPIGTLMERK